LSNVTEILETDESPGVDAIQPYEIVELQFIPEGRTEPVLGVDQIDSGSVPGLAKGATVEIEYQASNPRIVRFKGGSRTFPQKAYLAVAQEGGEYLALLAILAGKVCPIGVHPRSSAAQIRLQRNGPPNRICEDNNIRLIRDGS
jgi:hypothetical protein